MNNSTSQIATPLPAEHWEISQQVNHHTGEIVITYKAGVMSEDEMRSHLANLLQAAKQAEISTLQPSNSLPEFGLNNQYQTTEQPAKLAYSIAHAIPGRVRFHVPEIAVNPKYVQNLEALVNQEPAVTNQRINSDAASIVITYKTGIFCDAHTRVESIFDAVKSHFTSLIETANNATLTIV